ncbi:hypothetical protein C4573_01775 [Candidatus Woesearchaeota archaeon]|nr:MAG: hypothetical protein C4573_01775 [Candidatus Woesearchaeota archaeon]
MITCDKCDALCCKAIAVPIETPEKEDFEDTRWYLFHENVSLHIDFEGQWWVEFHTKCKNLKELKEPGKPKFGCAIYDKRPPMCRDYKLEECPRNLKEYKHDFFTLEQLDAYFSKQ